MAVNHRYSRRGPLPFRSSASAQNITAAGNSITPSTSMHRLTATGGAVTLTSTPTVADGTVDGQELTIINEDTTNAVTFQREAALAGSNLLLGAASRAVGVNGSLRLAWSTAKGAWVELGFLTAAS